MLMSSMFSGLNNCNSTISPHVHIQPTPTVTPDPLAPDLDEFDAIVKPLPPSGYFD